MPASPLRANQANRLPAAVAPSPLKTPPRHDALQAAAEAADFHSSVKAAEARAADRAHELRCFQFSAADTPERHDAIAAALEAADLHSAHKKLGEDKTSPPRGVRYGLSSDEDSEETASPAKLNFEEPETAAPAPEEAAPEEAAPEETPGGKNPFDDDDDDSISDGFWPAAPPRAAPETAVETTTVREDSDARDDGDRARVRAWFGCLELCGF
jgi:hypothetical protein